MFCFIFGFCVQIFTYRSFFFFLFFFIFFFFFFFCYLYFVFFFFFSSRRRHTRCLSDWSSDVCSSDLMRWTSPACPPIAMSTSSWTITERTKRRSSGRGSPSVPGFTCTSHPPMARG